MGVFEYACFISYRNGRIPDGLISEFARQLSEALEKVLDALLYEDTNKTENDYIVFLDQKVIGSGEFLPQSLGQSICKSFCWVVVLTRNYLGGALWCASELCYMLELERHRKELLGLSDPRQSFIIPILLKGDVNDFPALLKNRTINLEFKRFTLAVRSLEQHEGFVHAVESLAETIAARQKLIMDAVDGKNIDLSAGCQELNMRDINSPVGKNSVQEFVSNIKKTGDTKFPFI